jgi:hypothetical protein
VKLDVELPSERIDPLKDTEKAFDFAEQVILHADRVLPGVDLELGRKRLELVTDVLVQALVLPKLNSRAFARLFAKTIYFTIARNLPDKLRASKTPSPPRR